MARGRLNWTLDWVYAGRRGSVDIEQAPVRESISLERSFGGSRSVSIDTVLPIDVASLADNWPLYTGQAVLRLDGEPIIAGQMLAPSYYPPTRGKTRVRFTIGESMAADTSSFPPITEWRVSRNYNDVIGYTLTDNYKADLEAAGQQDFREQWSVFQSDTPGTAYEQRPVLRSEIFSGIPEIQEGQRWPWIFGTPGKTDADSAGRTLYPAVPAYVYDEQLPVTEPYIEYKLLVAGHAIDAGSPTIFCEDHTGRLRSEAIAAANIRLATGSTVARCDVNSTSRRAWWTFDDDASLATIEQQQRGAAMRRHYTAWSVPPRSGGGGRLLDMLLGSATIRVDWDALGAIRPLLDSYEFAGYIDRPGSALDLLRAQLAPLLPVAFVPSELGLRPVMLPSFDGWEIAPSPVTAGVGLVHTGEPVEYLIFDEQSQAGVTFQYAWDAYANTHQRAITVGPNTGSRFIGARGEPSVVSADWVYDGATASRVAREMAERRAWAPRVAKYQVLDVDRYGYTGPESLYVGKRVQITDTRLGLNRQMAVVGAIERNRSMLVHFYLRDDPAAS